MAETGENWNQMFHQKEDEQEKKPEKGEYFDDGEKAGNFFSSIYFKHQQMKKGGLQNIGMGLENLAK